MAYRKIEEYDEKTTQEIAGHIKAILGLLGEDTSREGLLKTPERVAKAMQFLTQGYFQDGKAIVKSALFQEPYNHMVIVKDIELFSLCEHHMLQVQERLTEQIRDCLQESLNPLGVAVVIEAMHTCMSMRGVQKSNAITTTSAFSGIFLKSDKTRNEFLQLIEK